MVCVQVDTDAAPSKKREENGKRHRAERRRSKERERVREAGVSRERDRASHRDRDGREREARGRDRERDSRSERYDRNLDGRQDRERTHRDKLSERMRPDERAGRREGASDVVRSRRDVAEAGQKRSRAEDPLRDQQERESRKARVVEFSDRGRDRAERAPAHHDSNTRDPDRHPEAYRRANNSSSALHLEAEHGSKAGGKGMESRAASMHEERRPSSAVRERLRPERHGHSLQKHSERAGRGVSDSPKSSYANGSIDGSRGRFAAGKLSPGESVEPPGGSQSAQPAEYGSPDQDGSGPGVRSASRSNSVDLAFSPSPGSLPRGTFRRLYHARGFFVK